METTDKPKIDLETGLPIMVPGLVQESPEIPEATEHPTGKGGGPAIVQTTPPKNATEARARLREGLANQEPAPQPLATRHLDPNYNPVLASALAVPEIGPPVEKMRCKLRGGYVFLYGERDVWKGPCILFLSKEDMKGQEHKLEILGDNPVVMEAKVKPDNVFEDLSARDRAAKIEELKSSLANLEAEQDAYLQSLQGRVEADKDTLTAPDFNPEAEAAVLKPGKATIHPKPPTEGSLEEFNPEVETAEDGGPPPSDPETQGRIDGPDYNPEAETNKGGRPAGKTSRVKKLG